MGRESLEQKKKRIGHILRRFRKNDPDAHCALEHKNPEELLVATILSAQCTDVRVNQVTQKLFIQFPDMPTLAKASLAEIEDVIRSTGFFRNKAKSIQGAARQLCEDHSGRVPRDFDAVKDLPGVGRKTANVVLGNAFGLATGIVVDTHVSRLSQRLGLTTQKTPEKIESDLVKLVPKSDWIQFSHWLISLGRNLCQARRPQCDKCFLGDLCPKKIK